MYFRTKALWLIIPENIEREANDRKLDFAGGLHGVEHAMIGMIPFHVMCDKWDIGGVSSPFHPDTGKPTIFVYDGFEGG